MSEFAMHVVKPVVDRTSLADTIIVKAARSGIPISHREDNSGDFILNRDYENMFTRSFSYAAGGPQQEAARLYMWKEMKSLGIWQGRPGTLEAEC